MTDIDKKRKKENLSDIEKTIILSMVAARTYSDKSCIDLFDEKVRDEWIDIIYKSHSKLKELNLVDIDINKLFNTFGMENPIEYILRINTNSLQRKTNGLFKSDNNKYFLDISRKSKILKDDLKELLRLIIDDKNIRNIEEIYSFCLNVSKDTHLVIFNPSDHIFSNPIYDSIIKDIFFYDSVTKNVPIILVKKKNTNKIKTKDVNKRRRKNANWYEKVLSSYEIKYSLIYINSRDYPPEFIDNIPRWGNTFRIIDVRTWKRYDAYMNASKNQISGISELYNKKQDKIKEGLVIGIANSPENINEVWIDFEYDEERKDYEKIIILSMIAARTFSRKSSLNLQDEIARQAWKNITDKTYEKLKELHLISLDKDILFDTGFEDPIVNLFRIYSRDLFKKTNRLFQNEGMNYFLNIFHESKVSKEDLRRLFNLIIDQKNLKVLEEIYSFCLNISKESHLEIFDPMEHIFSNPEYDYVIKEIIFYYL